MANNRRKSSVFVPSEATPLVQASQNAFKKQNITGRKAQNEFLLSQLNKASKNLKKSEFGQQIRTPSALSPMAAHNRSPAQSHRASSVANHRSEFEWQPTALLRAHNKNATALKRAKGKGIARMQQNLNLLELLAHGKDTLKSTDHTLWGPNAQPIVNPSQQRELSDQRYIISPLEHTQNLFANAYGMALHGQNIGKGIVQPVFMHHQQRQKFRARVQKELSSELSKSKHNPQNLSALRALDNASSLTGARMSMQGIENSVAYNQGHGRAGELFIESDYIQMSQSEADAWKRKNPRVKSFPNIGSGNVTAYEEVNAAQNAHTLLEMGVNEHTRMRANSCYSGTEHEIVLSNKDAIKQSMYSGSLVDHAGNWDNTYAGALQSELNKQSHGNESGVKASSMRKTGLIQTRGYLGPTSQRATKVYRKDHTIGTDFRVQIKREDKKKSPIPLRRADSSRTQLPGLSKSSK